ncbi:MAG: transcriptional regulator [Lawsonibacter sp.]|nr:transcriptional regulator [Lawsonibacter sp.]
MGMAVKVRMLLAARSMTIRELAMKMDKPTTEQNISQKLRRDNLTEKDLTAIAKACGATFEGSFILDDTGKVI